MPWFWNARSTYISGRCATNWALTPSSSRPCAASDTGSERIERAHRDPSAAADSSHPPAGSPGFADQNGRDGQCCRSPSSQVLDLVLVLSLAVLVLVLGARTRLAPAASLLHRSASTT